MRFRHVLLMELVEGTTESQRQAVISGLNRLPDQVHEIRFWQVGEDAGLLAGEDLDIAIIADFDNEQAYLTYRNHPDHLELITTVIQPVLKRIERVQFWTEQPEPALS